jgi:hypothetical protein
MKKLALTSLLVMAFAATSYAANLKGVTDTHVRTKHFDDGTTKSEVVGAKHTGDAASGETATLFFGGIGKFLDENLGKVKDVAKDIGKTAIGALNSKVNKTDSPAEVNAAANASSPIGAEG